MPRQIHSRLTVNGLSLPVPGEASICSFNFALMLAGTSVDPTFPVCINDRVEVSCFTHTVSRLFRAGLHTVRRRQAPDL